MVTFSQIKTGLALARTAVGAAAVEESAAVAAVDTFVAAEAAELSLGAIVGGVAAGAAIGLGTVWVANKICEAETGKDIWENIWPSDETPTREPTLEDLIREAQRLQWMYEFNGWEPPSFDVILWNLAQHSATNDPYAAFMSSRSGHRSAPTSRSSGGKKESADEETLREAKARAQDIIQNTGVSFQFDTLSVLTPALRYRPEDPDLQAAFQVIFKSWPLPVAKRAYIAWREVMQQEPSLDSFFTTYHRATPEDVATLASAGRADILRSLAKGADADIRLAVLQILQALDRTGLAVQSAAPSVEMHNDVFERIKMRAGEIIQDKGCGATQDDLNNLSRALQHRQENLFEAAFRRIVEQPDNRLNGLAKEAYFIWQQSLSSPASLQTFLERFPHQATIEDIQGLSPKTLQVIVVSRAPEDVKAAAQRALRPVVRREEPEVVVETPAPAIATAEPISVSPPVAKPRAAKKPPVAVRQPPLKPPGLNELKRRRREVDGPMTATQYRDIYRDEGRSSTFSNLQTEAQADPDSLKALVKLAKRNPVARQALQAVEIKFSAEQIHKRTDDWSTRGPYYQWQQEYAATAFLRTAVGLGNQGVLRFLKEKCPSMETIALEIFEADRQSDNFSRAIQEDAALLALVRRAYVAMYSLTFLLGTAEAKSCLREILRSIKTRGPLPWVVDYLEQFVRRIETNESYEDLMQAFREKK